MARWLLDLSMVREAWREITTVTDSPVALALAGAPLLMAEARDRLASAGGGILMYGGSPSTIGAGSFDPRDAVLVFVEPTEEDRVVAALRAAAPGGGGVIAVDEGPAATHAVTWYDSDLARVSFSDTDEGWHVLWEAVVAAAREHGVALARRYVPLRPFASERLIRKTAKQNLLVGVVFIVPGADMPVMTLNQVKMVLGIAAIHGEEITYERALELLGVIGVGFGLRAVARQFLDVVPGVGWAVKGAIGYTGTRAMGEAALRYFQRGAPVTPSRISKLTKPLVRRLKR